jgi:hypothetical protein
VNSEHKAVGTVMAHRKETPKELFLKELKRVKNCQCEEIVSSATSGVLYEMFKT